MFFFFLWGLNKTIKVKKKIKLLLIRAKSVHWSQTRDTFKFFYSIYNMYCVQCSCILTKKQKKIRLDDNITCETVRCPALWLARFHLWRYFLCVSEVLSNVVRRRISRGSDNSDGKIMLIPLRSVIDYYRNFRRRFAISVGDGRFTSGAVFGHNDKTTVFPRRNHNNIVR